MDIDYDKLLNEIKLLHNECKDFQSNKKINKDLSNNEFILKMQYKYKNIYENFSSIFKQCIENYMDIETITFMINKAKVINELVIGERIRDIVILDENHYLLYLEDTPSLGILSLK